VLLLDEIQYLREYETTAQCLYNLTAGNGTKLFKVVMTCSSAAHMTRLSISKLGGGRSKLYRLPPITFIEYLYFTGRIPDYAHYASATEADFADYLQLKGLSALTIQFDDDYFDAFYSETETGNNQRGLSASLVDLKSGDLQNMARILAYKLNEAKAYNATFDPSVGGQERYSLRSLNPPQRFAKGTDLSDAMVSESVKHVKGICAKDKARILLFMLNAGLACIELKSTGGDDDITDTGRVLNELARCSEEKQLRKLFDKASICLTAPLFYTKLGEDILKRADVDISYLCEGDMLGKMLETYTRGAYVMRSVNKTMSSTKLCHIMQAGDGEFEREVDVFDSLAELLLEVTISNKPEKNVNVNRYFTDDYFIRVCSTRNQNYFDGVYHRIPYPILCCMLDTGDIDKLLLSRGQTDEQRATAASFYGKPVQPADKTQDIVLAFINNDEGKRIGLRVWRRAAQQTEEVPLPIEIRTWNLDISNNRLFPKLCNLSDFPVIVATKKNAPLDNGAIFTNGIFGGWVIGQYENGRLRIINVFGKVIIIEDNDVSFYNKSYKLSNAIVEKTSGKLVGNYNIRFEEIIFP